MAKISFKVDGQKLVEMAEAAGELSVSEINDVLVPVMNVAGSDFAQLLHEKYSEEAGAVPPDWTGRIRSSIGWTLDRGKGGDEVVSMEVGLMNNPPPYAKAYLSGSRGASVGMASGSKSGPAGTPYQKLALWLLAKKGPDVEARTNFRGMGKGRTYTRRDGTVTTVDPKPLSRSKQFGSSVYWRVKKILEGGITAHPFVDKAIEDSRWKDIEAQLMQDAVEALRSNFIEAILEKAGVSVGPRVKRKGRRISGGVRVFTRTGPVTVFEQRGNLTKRRRKGS